MPRHLRGVAFLTLLAVASTTPTLEAVKIDVHYHASNDSRLFLSITEGSGLVEEYKPHPRRPTGMPTGKGILPEG